MQTIITKTGKEFSVAWIGVSNIDGILRFSVLNSDMTTVFTTFSNPEETETIVHTFGETPKEYVGYTVFRGVTLNYQNEMVVALSMV